MSLCRSKAFKGISGDCPANSVKSKMDGKGPGGSAEADTLVQGDPTTVEHKSSSKGSGHSSELGSSVQGDPQSSLGLSKTVEGDSGQPPVMSRVVWFKLFFAWSRG